MQIFDRHGYKPHIFTNKHEVHKTLCTSLVGLIAFLGSLILALYFIINSFSKLVPTIYSNTVTDIIPSLNLTDYPISIGVGLGEKAIQDPTYFTIQAWFINYYTEFINGKKEIKYNFTEYFLEPCTKEGYEKYNLTVQTDSLCLNPGKWNVTLSGIFGDPDTQFSYMQIDVEIPRLMEITVKVISRSMTTYLLLSFY
mgnify:CR=1 FL=1